MTNALAYFVTNVNDEEKKSLKTLTTDQEPEAGHAGLAEGPRGLRGRAQVGLHQVSVQQNFCCLVANE